jgi:uncharacterized protein (UPF0332 family)
MAAFDWIQYLVLARDLGTRADEAALRSAVSRAYYAAYNAANAYCANNNIQIFKNKGSHEDLWDAFLRQGDLISGTVHTKGDRLRFRRTKADYHSEVSGLASMAEQSLQDSHDILRSLGYASPPP